MCGKSTVVTLRSKVKFILFQYNRKNLIFFLTRMSREQKAVARARKAFETGRSKPLEHRIHQLKNLQRLLTERKREIVDAIKKDLGKVSSSSGSTLSSESVGSNISPEAYSRHLLSDQMPQITERYSETFEEQIH